MKLRCWVCAVLGLLLFQIYLHAGENAKPALALVKKGVVVKVTENEIVVKSNDEKQGEVSYPLKEVSQHVKMSGDAEKDYLAEIRTRSKYVAVPKISPKDIASGSEVSVEWGSSHIKDGDKVVEDGSYYQFKVNKLGKK
jgi:hypothetical protein